MSVASMQVGCPTDPKIPRFLVRSSKCNTASFVVYEISYKCVDDEGVCSKHVISRRYSDFLCLKEEIEEECENHIQIPFRGKDFLSYVKRFDENFLEKRRVHLETYLIRLCSHEVYKESRSFRHFFNKGGFLCKRFAEQDIKYINRSIGKMISSLYTKINTIQNPDPRFIVLQNNIDIMDKLFGSISGSNDLIYRSNINIAKSLKDMYILLERLSQYIIPSERLLAVSETMKCVHEYSSPMFSSNQVSSLASSVIDMAEYTKNARILLVKRDNKQIEYEKTTDQLKSLISKMNIQIHQPPNKGNMFDRLFVGKPTHGDEHKFDKLLELDNMTKTVENNMFDKETELCSLNNKVIREMQIYTETHIKELIGSMKIDIRIKLQYHTEMMETWKKCIDPVYHP